MGFSIFPITLKVVSCLAINSQTVVGRLPTENKYMALEEMVCIENPPDWRSSFSIRGFSVSYILKSRYGKRIGRLPALQVSYISEAF